MKSKFFKNILFILFFFISSTFTYASITTKKVNVKGVGSTYSKAISNALVEAISQVKGVRISSQTELVSKLNSIAYTSNKDSDNLTVINQSAIAKVQQATSGYIKSYKVLNSYKNNDNDYVVSVDVDIPEYVSDSKSDGVNLKKIAIIPFDIKDGYINVNGISKQNIANSIQQGLINQFTQSRKFNIVDRNDADHNAYAKEMAMIVSGQTPIENASKIGNKTSADYILTGTVSNFDITNKKTSYYGEQFSKYSVSATVSYRLLDLTTMQVRWAGTVTQSLPSSVATKYIEDHGGSNAGIESYLFDQISRTISDQVIGVVYPLTVLKVLDDNVYLNQGGDRVQRGAVYKVYERGTVVKDKSTGQLITVAGKNTAVVRIVDVMPKYSIAQVVDGNSLSIKVNDKAYLSK